MEQSEAIIIRQASEGDVTAFKQLYEQHIGRVYALCIRLCADKSQAEDAAQEVFIQAWKSLPSYQANARFSTWLHRLAANVTISYLRRQKSWWQKVVPLTEENDKEIVISDDIAHDKLALCVMRLPERARLVFVLHAIEGYRHEQVAHMLDIAESSSKTHYFRAKQKIQEYLSSESE